jgi:dipeptidyl aminopeptidase/acylaminoacyl peptidase
MALSLRFPVSAALILALTSVPAAGQEASADNGGPTLEDLFTVKSLGSVQVSPDGQAVLYTVSSADLDENETDTDIWLLRRDGSSWADPVQLTRSKQNDTNPQWRPDSHAFAFLSSRESDASDSSPSDSSRPGRGGNGGPQQKLYLMDSRGGEAQELLVHETAVSSFQWSPDGAFIAFRAADPESDDDKARKKNGRDINVEDELGRPSHLWVLDVESGDAHRVTEGDGFTVGSFDWNPDGSRLAFSATPSARPMDSWKSDIYVVSARDAGTTPTTLTENPGPDANPRWSMDGRYLYYSGQLTDRYQVAMNRLFRISLDGGDIEDMSPHADIQAGAFTLSSDGRGAFFSATTGTTRGVFYMSLEDRRPVRLTPDHGVYGSADLSDDGSTVVYTYENPNKAVELYAAPLSRRPTTESVVAQWALTSHNTHTSDWTLGNTEVMRWKGVDGRDVEGIVVYPHDWTPGAGPRATVVKIHGGPSGVYVENFQASSSTSDAQRYAADGYVVLLPNPRGSSGYGESGLQAVVGDWGGLDFQDIMTGVDTLIARGVSHPDSLGVMGWSYGGFMTAWTVTQTSRFKAAVAGAAITENIAMWGTQDIQHVFEAYFGGGPYEPGMWEVYQKSNPLAFIENATTPTMILHGENDPRVPPNQARLFYRGLKANGVEAKLVWLPRTGHGPREPGLRYETARHQKEWMDQWIRKRSVPITE